MSQMMATKLSLDEADPAFHGETEDKPAPAPSARRISDKEAATKAPAITADQDTPDEYASFFPEFSRNERWSAIKGERADSSIKIPNVK
jgi:hypothetical protein